MNVSDELDDELARPQSSPLKIPKNGKVMPPSWLVLVSCPGMRLGLCVSVCVCMCVCMFCRMINCKMMFGWLEGQSTILLVAYFILGVLFLRVNKSFTVIVMERSLLKFCSTTNNDLTTVLVLTVNVFGKYRCVTNILSLLSLRFNLKKEKQNSLERGRC